MKTLDTDVAIIGAGSAGLSAYRAVRTAGKRALLIEGGEHGTTCARVGCMPSKLLIAAAEAAHAAAHTAPFGVHVDGAIRIEGREVMERVKRERDRFVGFVLRSVAQMPDEDKLAGHARFVSPTVLRVDDHTEVHAGSVVIATGSSPVVPDHLKALGELAIVNDDVFAWDDLPKRVAVFGPGIIGLELGQALARLGVTVRMFGKGGSLAGLGDPVIRDQALGLMRESFYLDPKADVKETRRDGDEVMVRYIDLDGKEQTERFDAALVATGRKPNLAGLDLPAAGLPLDKRGVPVYDRHTLRIGDTPVFIAGDANQDLPLLHEASDEGKIAGGNAARYPDVQPGERRAPLAIVFTDPQIAQVGQRFSDLAPDSFVTGAIDFSDQGRSRVMLRNAGRLHVYADRSTGKFLGAEMIAPSGEHLAHLLAWAAQQELTLAQMLRMPFYHPVIEEGLRTALRDAQGKVKCAADPRDCREGPPQA